MVGLRLAILFLCSLATRALADVPVTSYDCGPGTQGNGSCTCPKSHSAKRDPADESKAICVASTAKPLSQIQPSVGGYTLLVAEGNDAASAMNCTKAEELYVKALAVNPKGVEALVGSGNCMAKQSKWTNAHAQFDKALGINPKHELALWSKAEAYRLAYNTTEAIAAYRNYLAAFPAAAKATKALKELGSGPEVARKPPPAKPLKFPKRTQDVVISIAGSKITANGVGVTGNGTVADWIAIYGKPDRTWSGSGINKIHTWDKLGFIVYEPTGNVGRASSATFLFKPMGQSYDPKTMFAGWILVDGTEFSATTSTADLKTKPGATTPYGATSVVFPKGAFNVFTTSKNGPLELVELSMWKTEKPIPDVPGTSSKTGVTAADVKVEASKTGVKVQGQEIGTKPTIADFKRIYGEPERVWKGKGNAVNHIHIWDSLGILVYEPVGTGKAMTLSMPYKPLDNAEFSPKTMFKGRVAIETRGFYNFNTIGTIAKREGATQPYGTDSAVFDLGGVSLFTGSKGGAETIGVVELSFWKK